jgi:hypothetical protein
MVRTLFLVRSEKARKESGGVILDVLSHVRAINWMRVSSTGAGISALKRTLELMKLPLGGMRGLVIRKKWAV